VVLGAIGGIIAGVLIGVMQAQKATNLSTVIVPAFSRFGGNFDMKFGYSIAVSQNLIAVGAPNTDQGSGIVIVYRYLSSPPYYEEVGTYQAPIVGPLGFGHKVFMDVFGLMLIAQTLSNSLFIQAIAQGNGNRELVGFRDFAANNDGTLLVAVMSNGTGVATYSRSNSAVPVDFNHQTNLATPISSCTTVAINENGQDGFFMALGCPDADNGLGRVYLYQLDFVSYTWNPLSGGNNMITLADTPAFFVSSNSLGDYMSFSSKGEYLHLSIAGAQTCYRVAFERNSTSAYSRVNNFNTHIVANPLDLTGNSTGCLIDARRFPANGSSSSVLIGAPGNAVLKSRVDTLDLRTMGRLNTEFDSGATCSGFAFGWSTSPENFFVESDPCYGSNIGRIIIHAHYSVLNE